MWTYLGVALIVFGVNVMPAFGPPTWSILVLFRLHSRLNAVALVALGAIGAALGRLCLAYATRALRGHLSEERRASLDALASSIRRRRHASAIGLVLFALSPVPSAQLFEAAGLTGLDLPKLVTAFFAGRIVSYSIYVAGASAVKGTSVGEMMKSSFTSPAGIALQVAFLVGVVAIGRIDWRKHVRPDES